MGLLGTEILECGCSGCPLEPFFRLLSRCVSQKNAWYSIYSSQVLLCWSTISDIFAAAAEHGRPAFLKTH
jgi:hypothetical protein